MKKKKGKRRDDPSGLIEWAASRAEKLDSFRRTHS